MRASEFFVNSDARIFYAQTHAVEISREGGAVRAASKENLPDSIHFCEMVFLIFLIYEQMLQAFDRGGQERAWYLYRRLVDQLDMGKLVNRQFEKYWGQSFLFGLAGSDVGSGIEACGRCLAGQCRENRKNDCFHAGCQSMRGKH